MLGSTTLRYGRTMRNHIDGVDNAGVGSERALALPPTSRRRLGDRGAGSQATRRV